MFGGLVDYLPTHLSAQVSNRFTLMFHLLDARGVSGCSNPIIGRLCLSMDQIDGSDDGA